MFGGTSQEIEITTSPPGANCALERAGKIVGRVNPTPGATMVAKSRKDITVTCTKENYADATGYSDSGVEPWVFMNLVFGGLIGLGIDHATGGVNEYDTPVAITLAPVAVERTSPPASPPSDDAPLPGAQVSAAGPTS